MQASNTPIDKYHMKMLELLLSDPEIAKEMKVDGKHISNLHYGMTVLPYLVCLSGVGLTAYLTHITKLISLA